MRDSLTTTGPGIEAESGRRAGLWAELRWRARSAREIYEGIYVAPYRSAIQREYLRQRDLFLVLGISDMLGVPSPVSFYTLELLSDAELGLSDRILAPGNNARSGR